VDAPQVDHERRADDHLTHAETFADRELIIGEGPFERADGGFDGGTRVAGFGARRTGRTPPLGQVEVGLLDIQTAPVVGLAGLGRTPLPQGAIGRALEAGDEVFGLATRLERGRLPVGAGEALGLLVGSRGRFEIGQRHAVRIGRATAKGGLNLHDGVGPQRRIDIRAAEAAIGLQSVEVGAFDQSG